MREQDLKPGEAHVEDEVFEIDRVLRHRQLEEHRASVVRQRGRVSRLHALDDVRADVHFRAGEHRNRQPLLSQPRV
jgi:hypothetical protein